MNVINASADEFDERLTELLLAWEDAQAEGKSISISELCGGAKDLEEALEQEIGILLRFRRLAEPVEHAAVRSSFGNSSEFPHLPGYEILDVIGRGGMGVVYKARQRSLGRLVAIKSLAGSRWAQPDAVARLRREAEILSQLNDPQILQVFDIIETAGTVSLILEFIDGENLDRRMKQSPLTSIETARLIQILARTIQVVHNQGLIHRDIKPANVLLDWSGNLKVADFGLAKREHVASDLTQTGDVFGTPGYMAPEQIRGTPVDGRTDIYSIGATLYEMLTGRPPFVGNSSVEVFKQIETCEPLQVRMINPSVSRDLETICLKCLEKAPGQRFQSAGELCDELGRFLQGIPIRSRPTGHFQRWGRWCQRRPMTATLIASLLAGVMIISGLLISSHRDLARHNRELRNAAIEMQRMERIARENERRAREGQYASDIAHAAIAWQQEDMQALTYLLDRHIPGPDEVDQRGFEWWYLHRRANRNGRVLVETGSPIYLIRYVADRSQLAAVGKDSIVRIFHPTTGEVSREIPTNQNEINGIAFSSNQTEFASAGDDGTIRVCRIADGSERLKIITPFPKAYAVLYTTDSHRIISCGKSGEICIYDALTGEHLFTLSGHTGNVESLYLSGGSFLASVSNDNTLKIWDLEEMSEHCSIASPGNVEALVFVKDRNLLITGNSYGLLRTIDVEQQCEIHSVRRPDRIGAISLHAQGKLLAVGDVSGKIQMMKIDAKGHVIEDHFEPWRGHEGGVNSIRWSNDGKRLISAGHDGRVVSWNLAAALNLKYERFYYNRVPDCKPFTDIPPAPLAILGGTLRHWNENVKLRRRSPGNLYQQFSVSSDGKLLATIADEDKLKVFAIPENPEPPIDAISIGELQTDEKLDLVGFANGDPTSLVVSHSREREGVSWIELHHVPNLKESKRVTIAAPKYAAVSPDGKQLAFSTPDSSLLWEIATERILWTVPESNVRKTVFSPDGRLVATVLANRSIVIRDCLTGTTRVRLTNHRSQIRLLAFSPDCRTLAAATEDGELTLTHVATGQELMRFPKIGDVRRIEFTPDGHCLICQAQTAEDAPDNFIILDASESLDQSEVDLGNEYRTPTGSSTKQ